MKNRPTAFYYLQYNAKIITGHIGIHQTVLRLCRLYSNEYNPLLRRKINGGSLSCRMRRIIIDCHQPRSEAHRWSLTSLAVNVPLSNRKLSWNRTAREVNDLLFDADDELFACTVEVVVCTTCCHCVVLDNILILRCCWSWYIILAIRTTDRSLRHASSHFQNQLPATLRQPHSTLCSPDSALPKPVLLC